jgi:membrane-associated phospholipid phosphatase
MLTKAEYIKLLVFILVISFVIIIQVLTAKDLFNMSVPIINSLQENSSLVTIMSYLTNLGAKKFKCLLLSTVFCLCNHYHTFLYAMVAYTAIAFCGILKINFQQPRPFWLSDEVITPYCPFAYGYPSNHVLSTIPAFLMFYEIIFYRFEVDKKVYGKIYWWIGFLIVLSLSALVGFSRMVLGVHSLDQVVFGELMGFALYYLFLYILDLDLRNPVPFFRILFSKYYFNKLMLIINLGFFTFIMNIILLNGAESYEDDWTSRIIRRCHRLPDVTPFFKCLIDVCDFFAFIGIIFGMLFDINIVQGIKNLEEFMNDYISYDNHSRVGEWNHTNVLRLICRIVITYYQCIFIMDFSYYLKNVLFGRSLIVEVVFGKMISMGLLGFLMFGVYRKEFDLLKLTNKKRIIYSINKV